jgi:hypothetical protein
MRMLIDHLCTDVVANDHGGATCPSLEEERRQRPTRQCEEPPECGPSPANTSAFPIKRPVIAMLQCGFAYLRIAALVQAKQRIRAPSPPPRSLPCYAAWQVRVHVRIPPCAGQGWQIQLRFATAACVDCYAPGLVDSDPYT